MTWRNHKLSRAVVVVWAGLLLAGTLPAQDAPNPGTRPTNHAAPSSLSPLELSIAKPPVEFFRQLLAMNAADRTTFLANRSPEVQKLILAKVREYESLPPEQRELRLRVTELRWYLLPLMRASTSNRAAQLGAIRADLRELVKERLIEWDKLAPEVQKDLLDNEAAVRLYLGLAAPNRQPQAWLAPNLSPAEREKLEPGLRQWQALTDDQRQAIMSHFNQFFDLTPEQKDKTLRTLSEPERLQIEKALHTFGSLTSAQRRECLRSFEKFASLSLEERQQFLKNAERWNLMTPTERQSWKSLVYNLSRQPPLPPGLGSAPPPPPPALPRPSRNSASWATNGN